MLKLSIKMFANSTSSADNIANVIIPQSCALVLVTWAINGVVSGASGGSGMLQLANQSTRQIGVNDARNIIDEFSWGSAVATAMPFADGRVVPIPGWRFSAGDKIYLHQNVLTALGSCNLNVNLTFA